MRYFAIFKTNTSLAHKTIIFNNISKQEAWEIMVKNYPEAIDKIVSEPVLNTIMPTVLNKTKNIVPFGTKCVVYDPSKTTTGNIKVTYFG